jgi:hypothetical protein
MEKSISRRALLVGGAVAGIGMIASSRTKLTPVLAQSEPQPTGAVTLTDGARHILVAIPPSDGRFDELVAKHFPGIVGDPTYGLLKGTCVILHNERGPGIHAHQLRWTFTLASGPLSTDSSTFHMPRPANGRPLLFCSRSASRPVMKKKAVALVSPFFTLTSGKSPMQQSVNWKKALRGRALQGFLAQSLPSITQTSVSIRSAIYHDHVVVDTDNGRFARYLKKKRNTEVQMAKVVLQKLNAGIPDAKLQGMFNRTCDAPRFFGSRKQVIFHAARKHHAKYLQGVLQKKGRDKLLKLVTGQANQRLTQFKRVSAA